MNDSVLRLGVSACLLGEKVRYDGGHKHDRYLTGTLGQIPVVGGLVRGGAFLFGLAMTLALGSIVIAAGWIFYRPLLALAIAAIGIAAIAIATRRPVDAPSGAC